MHLRGNKAERQGKLQHLGSVRNALTGIDRACF